MIHSSRKITVKLWEHNKTTVSSTGKTFDSPELCLFAIYVPRFYWIDLAFYRIRGRFHIFYYPEKLLILGWRTFKQIQLSPGG